MNVKTKIVNNVPSSKIILQKC